MSTIIQIKRSANVAAPTTAALLEAELAYSQDKSNDGAGAILYIESLDSTNTEVIHKIGGKYYTDIVDGATNTNTANKLVKRDANGNFAGNVITANRIIGTIEGTIEGVASSANIANTANALTTARDIGLAGDLTGNVSFNGSQNVTLTATIAPNSVALGTDTTGDYLSNVLAGTGIVITGQGGETATPTVTLATSGVTANTYGGASQIPVLTVDAQGRVTAAANVAVAGVSTFTASGNTFTISTADGGSFSASIQENSVRLGTDTTGAFVGNLVAGTGVTLTGLGNENATPTVAIGQDVATTANVTFNQANLTSANINGTTLTGGGSGFFVSPVAAGTTGNVVFYNTSTKELTFGAPASSSFTIVGDTGTDTFNTGDTFAIVGGTGVSTSATDNTITISNDGVLSVNTGYGISADASTGAITIDNTGVTEVISGGHGITVSSATGNVTVTNNGVTALTGTVNQIAVSGETGNITLSLPNNVTIPNNLTVEGNLSVSGNVTYVGTNDLRVEDPLIHLANNNSSTDLVDIGFVGTYFDNAIRHTGLFRDADTGTYKLFANLIPEPGVTVSTTDSSYSIATLVANITGGTVTGLTSAIVVADGGTGRNTLTGNAILFGTGTNQVGLASGTAGQVLQLSVDGVPIFSGLDGGTY